VHWDARWPAILSLPMPSTQVLARIKQPIGDPKTRVRRLQQCHERHQDRAAARCDSLSVAARLQPRSGAEAGDGDANALTLSRSKDVLVPHG
jgi:hypothetical protein